MLERGNIISNALLKLKEVNYYNDNKSDTYKMADFLFNNVLNFTATRVDFRFNATTILLNLNSNSKNYLDEYRYNLPNDFLNKIEFVGGTGRIENEFIYSTSEDLSIRYCRRIPLQEYPDYLESYLVYALATEMAESATEYADRLEVMNTRLEQAKRYVYEVEFQPLVRVI